MPNTTETRADRLSRLLEYFDTGCTCQRTGGPLSNVTIPDDHAGAVETYLKHCRCGRNLIDPNNPHDLRDYID